MGKIAEDSQFYKGKKEILDEFSGSHRTLMTTVASRNFSHPPGYLFESSIMLEETGKNKLSALNYQIVSDAIERELKQTGHNYTQTYKASRIAFEIEKQTLLTALQQEFADLDAVQSLSKEDLDSQFIELDIRKLILVTTKTAIELEMEGLRQELIATDRLTFDNETQLINEKVNTATAKLEIIPFLEDLIVAQENILVAEQANIPLMNNLMDEKELLAAKKVEITPYLYDKATAYISLATAILTAIPIEEQRLDVAISKAGLKMEAVDNTISILDAEEAVEALRVLLLTVRNDLQIAKIDRGIYLTDSNTSNIETISAAQTAMYAILEGYKVAIASSIRNAKTSISDSDLSGDEEAIGISVTADKHATTIIADYAASERKETATAAATAIITSKLIHLIGS